MRIPVQVPRGEDQEIEWVLIELQGELESNQAVSDSLFVGKFSFRQEGGQAELVIGDHILQGSEIALKKPFGIFRKAQSTEESSITPLKLVAAVEKKFLFSKRPRALISAPSL